MRNVIGVIGRVLMFIGAGLFLILVIGGEMGLEMFIFLAIAFVGAGLYSLTNKEK